MRRALSRWANTLRNALTVPPPLASSCLTITSAYILALTQELSEQVLSSPSRTASGAVLLLVILWIDLFLLPEDGEDRANRAQWQLVELAWVWLRGGSPYHAIGHGLWSIADYLVDAAPG